jgi:hypothetical protein
LPCFRPAHLVNVRMAHTDTPINTDRHDESRACDMITVVRSTSFFILCLVLVVVTWPASAQEPQTLGTYRDWSAFAYADGATRVCYMGTEPTDSTGDYDQRGDVWALVTHRSPGGSHDVVSVIAGYNYEEGAPIVISIGNKNFSLFSAGDTAWTFTDADDRDLVAAMKAGVDMTVKGRSWRGTDTVDDFSLLGFTAAYEAISQACAN